MTPSPDTDAAPTRERIVIRTPEDVCRLVDSGRFRPRRALLVMAVALGSIFVDGWDLSSFGLGAASISAEFGLGPSRWGLDSLAFVSATVLVGALVGGLAGGFLTDRVGRRRMFLVDLFLLVGAAVGCGLAPNVELFVLFRFLLGLGVGLDVPVALAFVAEFSAISNKGRNVNLAQVFSTGASAVAFVVVAGLVQAGLGEQDVWRWAIGLGAVPALAVLVLRFFSAVESPMWAARHQSLPEAVSILERSYHVDAELVVESDGDTRHRQTRLRDLGQLFRPPFGIRTTLVSVLVVMQAVEFYAITLYTPIILTTLLGDASLTEVLLVSALANTVGALGAWTCTRVTQRLGLRRLAVIGYLGTGTALVGASAVYDAVAGLSAALILLFYFMHNVGPGYAGTAMGTLSFPTSIRGISGGYTQAITRVGGVAGAYTFPVLSAATSERFTIGAIVAAPVVALVALALIPWDPIGRDVEVDEFTLAVTGG